MQQGDRKRPLNKLFQQETLEGNVARRNAVGPGDRTYEVRPGQNTAGRSGGVAGAETMKGRSSFRAIMSLNCGFFAFYENFLSRKHKIQKT